MYISLHFFVTLPISAINSVFVVLQEERLRLILFFLPPYDAAGIRTHINRDAPTRDLLKDALPAELPRRGYFIYHTCMPEMSVCLSFLQHVYHYQLILDLNES